MGTTSGSDREDGARTLVVGDAGPKAGANALGATTAGARTPIDALGSIYPRDVPPEPMAQELCAALHLEPARRRTACCGGAPIAALYDECVRVVSASLVEGAIELDRSAALSCASSNERAFQGCDWVTPGQPLPPAACVGAIRGQLAAGSICRSSLECAGNLHCEGLGPTKTGKCAKPSPNGAVCGAQADTMATYAFASDLDTSHPVCAEFCSMMLHKCQPAPEPGASCLATVNCAPGQACVAGHCTVSGPSHVALASTGAACASDLDCAVGGCIAGAGGRKACGAKCSPTFDALESKSKGMHLPARPKQ